mmetsp:Transcript_10400/g.14686  ORF Transcript_10400/g.14686 Transcript_10400/m.14686 type:complete len:266 (-) Transcript_10400:544-1341(-)
MALLLAAGCVAYNTMEKDKKGNPTFKMMKTTNQNSISGSSGMKNDVPLKKSLNSIVEGEQTTDDNTSATSSNNNNHHPQQKLDTDGTTNGANNTNAEEVGLGSFDLSRSASVQQAQFRIQQAQHDREMSRIPKPFIPFVEIMLPANTRLKDVEDHFEERIENLQQLFSTCGSGLGCVASEHESTVFTQQATGIGWTPSTQQQHDDASGMEDHSNLDDDQLFLLDSPLGRESTRTASTKKSSSSSYLHQPIRIRTARTRSSRTEEY